MPKVIIPPTTTGPSAVIGLDPKKPATVQVYTTGAGTWTLEYTLDNIMTDPAPRWMAHPGMTGVSASGSALLTTPVQAVRLNVASNAAAIEFRALSG